MEEKDQCSSRATGRERYVLAVRAVLNWAKLSFPECAMLCGVTLEKFAAFEFEEKLPKDAVTQKRCSDIVKLFVMLEGIYPRDYEVVARLWLKRKNWRRPFYSKTPLELIGTDPNGFLLTMEYLERLIRHCEGICTWWTGMILPGLDPVQGFNEFLHITSEDPDILAAMMLRITKAWKLSPRQLEELTTTDSATLRKTVSQQILPEDALIERWRFICLVDSGSYIATKYRGASAATEWVHSHRSLPIHKTPLEVLLEGDAVEKLVLLDELKHLTDTMRVPIMA